MSERLKPLSDARVAELVDLTRFDPKMASLAQEVQESRAIVAALGIGAMLIVAERTRQFTSEGFTPEHDEAHGRGELAMAAVCYAAPIPMITRDGWCDPWPWSADWDKRHQHDRVKQLAIAGALIAAEIDRLHRAAAKVVFAKEDSK